MKNKRYKKTTGIAELALASYIAINILADGTKNHDFEKIKVEHATIEHNIGTIENSLDKEKTLLFPWVYDYDKLNSIVKTENKNEMLLDSLLENMFGEEKEVENHYIFRKKKQYAGLNDTTSVITKDFLKALIYVESRYNPEAISPVGAVGWGQFMRKTWRKHGKGSYDNAYNPELSLNATYSYSKSLESNFSEKYRGWNNLPREEKQIFIAGAYNSGFGGFMSGLRNGMNSQTAEHMEKYKDASIMIRRENNLKTYLAMMEYTEQNMKNPEILFLANHVLNDYKKN